MKVHDLQPAAGSNQAPQARRPRHRRQGRQDRRPRHQGPEGPRHGPGRLRRRPDAAAHADPEAQGLHQPVPRRVPGRQPRRPRGQPALDDVIPGDAPRAAASSARAPCVKVLGRGEITRAVTVKAHAFSEVGRSGHHRRGRYAWNACPSRGASVARPPRATSSPTAHPDRLLVAATTVSQERESVDPSQRP